jgi:catechol 2,3-dioxygenase-like lactoylglutathione lyase family enzyme
MAIITVQKTATHVHRELENPMAKLSVLETVLYAEDLPAVLPFYHDLLGFDLFSQEEGRHVFFRSRDSMLLIFNPLATAHDVVSVGGSEIPQHGARGPGHVAFAIAEDAVSAWRHQLQEFGVEVESEVHWPGGGISLYVRDPAGNSVELATRSLWFDVSEGATADAEPAR